MYLGHCHFGKCSVTVQALLPPTADLPPNALGEVVTAPKLLCFALLCKKEIVNMCYFWYLVIAMK